MTLTEWFIFFLILQAVHFAGTWRLYEKAGRKRWEAAVPVYNAIVLMKIINRPRWWVILLFIPVVNLIMFPVVWVQTLEAFGKRTTTDAVIGVLSLGLYIYVINYDDKTTYNPERDMKDSTFGSLLFAIVVATLVHTYIMQPFNIPSSSLEKTLLVGDFLFVSKFHYGARTPRTTVAAPMVHDTIPFLGIKSYTNWPQLPSFRFPGFEKPEKNDIVVFNWPVDTVKFFGDKKTVGLRKPIDKKSNYVKRCVGTPGDSLSIKNGIVYINGKELKLSDRAKLQYNHILYAAKGISPQILIENGSTEYSRAFVISNLRSEQIPVLERYARSHVANADGTVTIQTGEAGIPLKLVQSYGINLQETLQTQATANLTLAGAESLRKAPGIDSIVRIVMPLPKEASQGVFPGNQKWSFDNLGPIYIPEQGKTVALNNETLPFYKIAITEYEHNDLKVNGDQILINGKPSTSYTFKQNYYWMMGDNRHNSEDSRAWGFVPQNHIVGKPVFVWMSLDPNETWGNFSKKVRWDRMFTTVGGDGEPVSYFKYFVIVLVLWFGFDYFRKKRKTAKS